MTQPIGLAEDRPFTVHDLAAMSDDGRRYELVDGMLLVTPTPGWSHQEMSASPCRVLHAACPPELRVLPAPFAVRTALSTEVQPDVLVAQFADLTEAYLSAGGAGIGGGGEWRTGPPRVPPVPGIGLPGATTQWPAPASLVSDRTVISTCRGRGG